QRAFEEVAQEFQVTPEIPMSVSYNEKRWNPHNGEPSTSGGYGIMHSTQFDQALISDAKGDGISETKKGVEVKSNLDTLNQAAKLLDLDPEILKANPVENIRGGAALLAQYAEETMGEIPNKTEDWYGAVATYNGLNSEMLATDFADRVYTTIHDGAERTVSGQYVILYSKSVHPNKKSACFFKLQQFTNNQHNINWSYCIDCVFIPAAYEQYTDRDTDYRNYDLAERPDDGLDIRYIVIHAIEGTYESAVNWLQD